MIQKYQFWFIGCSPESTSSSSSSPATLLPFDISELRFPLLSASYKSHRECFYCEARRAN